MPPSSTALSTCKPISRFITMQSEQMFHSLPHRVRRRAWLEPTPVGSLPFIGILISTALGAGANAYNAKFCVRNVEANNTRPAPEARSPPMMIGEILVAGGLYLSRRASSKHVHWIGFVIVRRCVVFFLRLIYFINALYW